MVYIIRIFEKRKDFNSFIGYYGGQVKFLGRRKLKVLHNITNDKELALYYDTDDYNIMYNDMKLLEKKFKNLHFEINEIEEGE